MEQESEPEAVEVHKQSGAPRTFKDRVAQVRQGTARAYETVKQKASDAREAYKYHVEKREVRKEERRVHDIERYKKETEYLKAKHDALQARQRVVGVKQDKWKALGNMFGDQKNKAKEYSSFQPSQGGLYSGDNFMKHIMGIPDKKKTKQTKSRFDTPNWWK